MKKRLSFISLLLLVGLVGCRPVLDPSKSSSERPSHDSSETSEPPSSSGDSSSEEGSGGDDSGDDSSDSGSDSGDDSSSVTPVDNPVTLSWGDVHDFSEDIENISPGEDRKAGTVKLKASVNYTGRFTARIKTNSMPKAPSEPKLIDYLTISIYEGNHTTKPTTTAKGTITPSTPYTGEYRVSSFDIEGTPTGTYLTIFVSLSLSASDTDISNAIQHDDVYLEIDWCAAS